MKPITNSTGKTLYLLRCGIGAYLYVADDRESVEKKHIKLHNPLEPISVKPVFSGRDLRGFDFTTKAGNKVGFKHGIKTEINKEGYAVCGAQQVASNEFHGL